jgi:hypothetical protein
MSFKRLDRGELIAAVGGIILGISLFLVWFDLGNAHAQLNACRGPNGTCTGWASLKILRFLLLIAAAAPAILAWIVMRGHGLSWPRGELTAVVALAALAFTLFRGVLDRPGAPRGEITISYGWWIAIVGGLLIFIGAVWRSSESAAARKPPGVL